MCAINSQDYQVRHISEDNEDCKAGYDVFEIYEHKKYQMIWVRRLPRRSATSATTRETVKARNVFIIREHGPSTRV